MALWSGKTIGKVQVGDMIARGGMAEVYYGEHMGLNRKVAVKIMRDFVEIDSESRMRFDREARVIASLQHPNIIQIFDYELINDHPCLVMELIPNVSLGTYLRNAQKRGEKLSFDIIAKLLTEIASAVDYAHSQNIVHRDIKPANILLRSKNGQIELNQPLPSDIEPVLTDFGLVRLLDSSFQTSTGSVSGTPAYMSPEQARGDKIDKKTDIYSLGVVLYEMLAGRVPFDAESSFGVLMKHLNDPPAPISHISSDLQLVIDRALAKEPAMRYNSAKELVDEFINVFNGQTVSLNTISISKISQKAEKPQKKPSFSFALMAIGVVAVIFLGIIALRPIFTSSDNVQEDQIGKANFLDFNNVMDKINFTFNDLPVLEEGTHYDVWLLAEGGETRRNIGSVNMTGQTQGELVFIHSGSKNLLGLFDQVEVTIEADNDPLPDESSGNVVASSVFPPFALVHVRHVLDSYPSTPDQVALIQGLWYSAFEVDRLVTALQDAKTAKDEETFKSLTDELILQLVGNANVEHHSSSDSSSDTSSSDTGNTPVYPDIEETPNLIFGLLGDGEETGYLPNVTSHVEFSAGAPDATSSIKNHAEHVLICLGNIQGWSDQLLKLANELKNLPMDDERTDAIINEMRVLSAQILTGVDSNNNELIEPIVGEGGADTAYEHAYYMADMPLFVGSHRVHPPAPTQSP